MVAQAHVNLASNSFGYTKEKLFKICLFTVYNEEIIFIIITLGKRYHAVLQWTLCTYIKYIFLFVYFH